MGEHFQKLSFVHWGDGALEKRNIIFALLSGTYLEIEAQALDFET